MAELTLKSSAFENNGPIPKVYTCDDKDVSPPLTIENVPKDTKSLVLIIDDPDAPRGTWDHWIVWDIPPATTEIKEREAPQGAIEGINDFGKHEYGGPCPPSGTHRYMFKLYALNVLLDLSADSKKEDVEKAMKGHILAETLLVGTYQR